MAGPLPLPMAGPIPHGHADQQLRLLLCNLAMTKLGIRPEGGIQLITDIFHEVLTYMTCVGTELAS